MQKTLEKEQEDDQEIYDQMSCWCKTNDREKSKAIKDAEQLIDQLQSRIEELTAQSSRLNTEIENLQEEVAENQASLDKATALREKQLAEFNQEEKDMLGAISALKQAVTVLSKHHSALLQESDLISVASSLHRQMQKFAEVFAEVVSPSQRRLLQSFVQQPMGSSYNSQSGEIYGILQNMQETFEANLSDAQKAELTHQQNFEQLKASKEEEISAGNAQIDKKSGELAEADENNANSKEQVEDTKSSLSADEQFLMNLKEQCAMTDKEWEQRQKARQEEIQSVSKALEILSSDDAHDNFTKTFNSFVQLSDERVQEAKQVLKAAAAKFHNPQLSNLANKVRLNAFTKVKAAIDQMVEELLKQKEDEIKHKDWCAASLNTNESQTKQTGRNKQDEQARADALDSKIKNLEGEIEKLTAEIADMKVQLKRAGEDREKENKEFQTTVEDQRETKRLLSQALNVLKGVYAKKALLQQPAGPPPPSGFKGYKQNAQSGGVITMIQQIIDDAEAMEKEAIRDETDAQQAYEDFVKETNRSISEKRKGRTNAASTKAEAEENLVEANQNIKGLNVELDGLGNEKSDIKKSCDFVLKNFDIRQQARDEEVEALRQAKAILSGSKFANFLQKH